MISTIRLRLPLVRRSLLLLLASYVTLSCAVNPATGRRELSLIGEGEEIRMGREADPDIVASMGLHPDEALQAYVNSLGQDLAAVAERPNLPWTFRVVDDPTVNAFALPGGFIYVTRGIMAHMNSEAQLVGILGHEIGHVTAKHSVNQMSRSQLTGLGLGLGMIFSENVRRFGDALGAGLQLLTLKYGRDDETQADQLGFRYMTRLDYDPRELAGVFRTLDRLAPEEGRVPGWLSTHPNPADRQGDIGRLVAESGRDFSGSSVRTESYLRRLDGMVFGRNPREGFFEGEIFHHPDLRFRLGFPAGWDTINQKSAVVGVAPRGDAVLVLELAVESTVEAAADAFSRQSEVRISGTSSESIGGFPTRRVEFTATTENTTLAGAAAFVDYDGNVYQLLGYTTTDGWRDYRGAISATLTSFREESDPDVLAVQPQRIELVEVRSTSTVQELLTRYPSAISGDEVMLINGFEEVTERVAPGRLFKSVR